MKLLRSLFGLLVGLGLLYLLLSIGAKRQSQGQEYHYHEGTVTAVAHEHASSEWTFTIRSHNDENMYVASVLDIEGIYRDDSTKIPLTGDVVRFALWFQETRGRRMVYFWRFNNERDDSYPLFIEQGFREKPPLRERNYGKMLSDEITVIRRIFP